MDREPWEIQENESDKAFEAFTRYRDMGASRSVRKVAQSLGKSETLISEWSSKYEWVKRVREWDNEQDRIVRQAQLDDVKKMRKRHAEIASSMLLKAARALKNIPDEDIKASDISRMVDVASKLERLSRGDTSEVIEERNGGQAPSAVQFYIPDNFRDKKEDEK